MHTHVIKSTTRQLEQDINEWDPKQKELVAVEYQGGRDWVFVIRHDNEHHGETVGGLGVHIPVEVESVPDGRYIIQDENASWMLTLDSDARPESMFLRRDEDGDVLDRAIVFEPTPHPFQTDGSEEMRDPDYYIARCTAPGCGQRVDNSIHKSGPAYLADPVQPDLGEWSYQKKSTENAIEFQTGHQSLGRIAVTSLGGDKAAEMIATHLVNILNRVNGGVGLHPQSKMVSTNDGNLLPWINVVAHTLTAALRDPHDHEAIAQAAAPLWNPPAE